jgi:hypothetical protein
MFAGLLDFLNSLPPEARKRLLGALAVVLGGAFQPVQAWLAAKARGITASAELKILESRLQALRDLAPSSAEIAKLAVLDLPATKRIAALKKLSDAESIAYEHLIQQEQLRLSNLLRIVEAAAPMLKEVAAKPVSPEWLLRFRRESADTTDAELQTLWARLLAGEIGHPGRFSLRTVDVVSKMRRSDADNFTALCGLIWTTQGSAFTMGPPLEYLLRFAGLSVRDARYLEYGGLVHFGTQVEERIAAGQEIRFFDLFVFSSTRNFRMPTYPLTDVGQELMSLAGGAPNKEYFEYSKDLLENRFAKLGPGWV